MQWEWKILDSLQALRSPAMDWLMASLSRLGNGGLLWLLLAGGLLLYRPTRRQGLAVLLALALEVLLCNILLKPWLARPRPFWLRPDMELLLAPPADFSFPSGHTAAAFAVAGALQWQKSPLSRPILLLAVFMGFSRLYLYVHFPTDVLGGVLLGLACGVLASALSCRIFKKTNN